MWATRQTASRSGSAPNISLSFAADNQVASGEGIAYDSAGNMSTDNQGDTYTYDAEGRVTSASFGSNLLASYRYDSDGNLVYENGGNGVQLFERDAAGHSLWIASPAGFNQPSPYPYDYGVYIDGEWLGSWEDGTLVFAGKDWLGTKRYEALGQGDSISTATPIYWNSYTSLPFGDNLSSIGGDPGHFTGKERDAESGLDYFGARYYASSMGRFMSPDPLGGHMENPQSLNKYVYALNNPLTNTDPTGLDSYLGCTQAWYNTSTCQSQRVGGTDQNPQMATVQGVTGANGFIATRIGNNPDGSGGLIDLTTGTGSYTASVNGSGVQFSNDGGQTSSTGVFVNGTPSNTFQDAGFANGGALSGFTFTLTNSKMEANQTEAGTFTFAGTPDAAGAALRRAGFDYHSIGENPGMYEYRSSGEAFTGANSGHFNLYEINLTPNRSVPQTQGNMHFGEHNPFTLPFGLAEHCHADGACK